MSTRSEVDTNRHKSIAGFVAWLLILVITGTAHAIDLRSWDLKLAGSPRFVTLWNGAVVLDRETQLVWERSPSTALSTWEGALRDCYSKKVGDRKGWRLPTVEELFSLVDPSVNFPGPTLPTSHPFIDIQSAPYWSITSRQDVTSSSPQLNAWGVDFSGGGIASGQKNGSSSMRVWCVRGGHGYNDSR